MFPPFRSKKVVARVILRHQSPCLVASFSSSTPPIIWQFDLEKMSHYVLCLREKDSEWDLGISLPQGTFTPVAHFDERNEAEEAFAATRKALISTGPRIGTRTIFWLCALGLLILTILFVTGSFDSGSQDAATNPSVSSETAAPPVVPQGAQMPSPQKVEQNGPKTILPGQPMNADDVMVPPQD